MQKYRKRKIESPTDYIQLPLSFLLEGFFVFVDTGVDTNLKNPNQSKLCLLPL